MKRIFFLSAFVANIICVEFAFSQDIDVGRSSEQSIMGSRDVSTETGSSFNIYSKLFVEATLCTSRKNDGFGVTMAYVPTRIGGYAAARTASYLNPYLFSLGAVVRPVRISKVDLQLTCGPALKTDLKKDNQVGCEFGFRLSPVAAGNGGWFGWWSVSGSYAICGETSFYTCGFSVIIAPLLFLWSKTARFL